MTNPTPEHWTAMLTLQAQTAHDIKLARSRAVLRHIDLKAPEMWARVELDTAELAEAAWRADVDAKVLWAVYGNRPNREGDE